MSDLTPPGPDPQPGTNDSDGPKGGLSVDDWIAANAGRATRQTGMSPYGSPTPYAGPPPSRAMAGWALGLSLLPCLTPLGQLTALGLSIAVLVKSRDGRDHGKGMAVAGLIISILVLLAIVAYIIVIGVSYWKNGWDETERDADGRVTDAGLVSIDRLRVGDCVEDFQTTEEVNAGEWSTGEARVVPCNDAHIAEIYAINTINPRDYADQRSLDFASAGGCIRQFDNYVGLPYRRSTHELNYYTPTVRGDGILDDQVICMVTRTDGPSSAMIKGSGK